jgi:hypothetical protein
MGQHSSQYSVYVHSLLGFVRIALGVLGKHGGDFD